MGEVIVIQKDLLKGARGLLFGQMSIKMKTAGKKK